MTNRLKFKPNAWHVSESARQTLSMGEKVGRQLKSGTVVMLEGAIGAGKTTLTKGMARGLGLKTDASRVLSPTFVLIHEYPCRVPLYHIDLYRLDRIGFEDRSLIEECINSEGITVLEWGERAKDFLPADYLRIQMRHCGGDERNIRFEVKGRVLWR